MRREADSDLEVGIGIGSDYTDLDIIIDSNNKVVEAPIWDYKPSYNEGSIWFDL